MNPAVPIHTERGPLSDADLERIDAYWRAANYLSIGQIYLYDNPLLREPLKPEQIKPRLLGHWGRTPGQNFIYAHLNRIIQQRDLNMIYISGPGHGGPALVANTCLEGSYTELYPEVSQDETGMQRSSSVWWATAGRSSRSSSLFIRWPAGCGFYPRGEPS